MAPPLALDAPRTRPEVNRAGLAGAIWTIVRTDFKVRYHGTVAGFVWAMFKPLAVFGVLLWVFSHIFPRTEDYRIKLIMGLFLWDFFAESTKVGLMSLNAKAYLLGRSRFPRWILVATSSANALITLGAFSLGLFAFLAWQGRWPGLPGVLMYLLCVFHLFVIGLGFSLAASVLFLRYRDLNQVWEVVSYAGFFLAPIVYPIDIMPEHLHAWLYLWPPTPVIEFARAALVSGTLPTWRGEMLLACGSLLILFVGSVVYRKLEPRSAEYL